MEMNIVTGIYRKTLMQRLISSSLSLEIGGFRSEITLKQNQANPYLCINSLNLGDQMGFELPLPRFWQKLTLETSTGEKVEGLLAGLHCENGQDNCVIQLESGERKTYTLSAIKQINYNFGSFDDTIYHLSQSGESRHCPYCYLAVLFAVDMLSVNLKAAPFLKRRDLIKKGLINYISCDYSQAAYSLIPQAEGIINEVLHEEGLLKETKGFPMWAKEHPMDTYHGKQCNNLVKAIEGARDAGNASKLSGFLTLGVTDMNIIREVRNKLSHGTLTEISEHEVASVIYLLHALYHATQLNVIFGLTKTKK
jgi:hypothetical protein